MLSASQTNTPDEGVGHDEEETTLAPKQSGELELAATEDVVESEEVLSLESHTIATKSLLELLGTKPLRAAGECFVDSEDPEALAEALQEYYRIESPYAVNPQAGVVTAPDDSVLVLSGKVYEMYQLCVHVRRLLNFVHGTMDRSHVDNSRNEMAIVKSSDANESAINFRSYVKLYTLSQELEGAFFKAIQENPYYSKSKVEDSVHDYKGLYRDVRRNFSMAKFRGMLPYMKKKAGELWKATIATLGFNGKREEEKMTISRRLKKSLQEGCLEKRIDQQLSNIQKAKSPIRQINLALVVVAESIDELRTLMSGLYADDKRIDCTFHDVPKTSPVGRFPVSKSGGFSWGKGPMELAMIPDIVVRDWKSGSLISYPLDQSPDLVSCLEAAIDNYRVTEKQKTGNEPKVPFRKFIADIREGKHTELSLVREGKRVSFIAHTDDGAKAFPLGLLTKDEGAYYLVAPHLEEIRNITRDEYTTLDDCMVCEQANEKGEIESDLLAFGDDRILSVDYEFEQVSYVVPAAKNSASWWSRTWQGTGNPHEYMRRLSVACDRFRHDLRDCEFRNRSIIKKKVSSIGESGWIEE